MEDLKVDDKSEEDSTNTHPGFSFSPAQYLEAFFGIKKEEQHTSRKEFIKQQLKSDWAKISETLVEAAEGWESYGWEFVCEENGITITRTSVPNSTVKCTKGVAVMKASPKRVFDLIRSIDRYKTWDTKIVQSDCIIELEGGLSLNYFEFAPWFPVSARDVVFMQYAGKNPSSSSANSYVVYWHSAEDPETQKRKGVIRASMGTSGFVISPLQKNSLVTFILQFDLKGWIPSNVMNQVTAAFPLILDPISKVLELQNSEISKQTGNA